MAMLKCEICGSNDLVKQDGVFVCQSCGCKYSVEEAKKMMVEGTVEVTGTIKIDDSQELTNLYQLARNAKDRKDYKEAAKYYNELLLKKPNSWEANYYTVYSQAMDIKVGEIPNEITRVSNNIAPVFNLITKNNYTAEEKAGIMDEIGTSFFCLIMLYFNNTSSKDISVTTMLIEAQENFYRQFCNSFANDENFMKSYGLLLLNKKIKGEYIYISSDLPMYKLMVEYRNILGKEVVKNTNSICEQILKDYNYKSEGHNELSNEESQERKYFKMQIVDMFQITGRGTVITGSVESGKINVNEQIYINNKMYTVAGIESNRQIINSASEGMNIGILIKGKTTNEFEKGSIVTNRIDSISSETHINIEKHKKEVETKKEEEKYRKDIAVLEQEIKKIQKQYKFSFFGLAVAFLILEMYLLVICSDMAELSPGICMLICIGIPGLGGAMGWILGNTPYKIIDDNIVEYYKMLVAEKDKITMRLKKTFIIYVSFCLVIVLLSLLSITW